MPGERSEPKGQYSKHALASTTFAPDSSFLADVESCSQDAARVCHLRFGPSGDSSRLLLWVL